MTTKLPQAAQSSRSPSVLVGLCAFVLLSLPGAGYAQMLVGCIDGGDDEVDLGRKVLMANGQAFAFARHQDGSARFLRWSIALESTMFQPDPGSFNAGSDGVPLVSRHQGAAIMALDGYLVIYERTGSWNSAIVTELADGPLPTFTAMVRRHTYDGSPLPFPLAVAEGAEYEIILGTPPVVQASVTTLERPPDTPSMIRTSECLLFTNQARLSCAGADMTEFGVVLDDTGTELKAITEIDASDSHITVLGDRTAFLLTSARDLVSQIEDVNTVLLTEHRYAIATAREVQVFLNDGSSWCMEATLPVVGVVSMDFSEDEEMLLLGIPTARRLEAYEFPPPDMVTCAGEPGDAGLSSDGGLGDGGTSPGEVGPSFDGGPSFDAGADGGTTPGSDVGLVERAELSCTCRVGSQSPSPFAWVSGALCLGVLFRRRR